MSFINVHVLHSYCLTVHTVLILENIIMVSNFSMCFGGVTSHNRCGSELVIVRLGRYHW